MKDDPLKNQLRAFKAPEPSEAGRARARHRALIAFQQTALSETVRPGWKSSIWNWRTAVGFIVIVGALALFAPPEPAPRNAGHSSIILTQHRPARENLADDRQILEQMEKLFPHRVNAVVEESGKVDLAIADSNTVGSGQPVVVVFKQGSDTIQVLSYSGHRVCLMLGKTRRCLEILATPSDEVILEDENGAWLSSDRPEIAGYSVQAETLEASL